MEEGPLRRDRGLADRQGRRREASRPTSCEVAENTANTLILDKPHEAEDRRVLPDRVQPQPIRGGDPNSPGPSDSIIREEKVAPGRTETWILCNLDRPGQEVTGKYLRAGPARLGRAAPAGRPVRVRPPGARCGSAS